MNLNNKAVNGPRVVSPHSQGLQGSHLNLSQTSAQRHRTYFLLNNKAVDRHGAGCGVGDGSAGGSAVAVRACRGRVFRAEGSEEFFFVPL